MASQSSPPLRTSADDLLELVKRRGKMAVDEVAKTLGMPPSSVQALVDFMVEERVLGIEYKFTTPYVYFNDIGNVPQSAPRAQPSSVLPTSQQSADLSAEALTLIANIRVLLDNKQFSEVEDSYDALWKKVSRQNLTWDRGLYEEMIAINDQIGKVTGSLYQEFAQKSGEIRQMIAKAQAFVQAHQPDAASKLHEEITIRLEALPTLLYQEKKALEREVLRLYRDIHEALGASTAQKVAMLSRSISEQAGKLRPYLLSGNIPLASEHYVKLTSLYADLPSGFLPLKINIGKELAQSYKTLAIQLEIENLRGQLHPLTRRKAAPEAAPEGSGRQKVIDSGNKSA